jgi:ADP-ribosylglycohydrolase
MVLPRDLLQPVLLAGAAGDAIGGRFEGCAADTARGLPPPPWVVSDDTRLTFATCRAIAKAGAVDPEAIASEFIAEYRAGLPGVGSSTLKALRDLAAGQHWALAGASGEFSAGNGAAMRIGPLAFFGDVSDRAYARSIRDVASITHRNDEAIAGALAIVWSLQLLGVRHALAQVLRALLDELPDTALSDSLAELAKLPVGAPPQDAASTVGTTGRTSESVALAIFIGATAQSVEDAITTAVRCGGDTDTVAALSAQLCASAGGAIPPGWSLDLPCEEARLLTESLAALDARRPRTVRKRMWGLF